jgi:hypothetical protein
MASEVERLRAELKKARKAVTNKINRVQKSTGAKVGGSEFDPRRRVGVENSYNAKQLQTHLAQLKDFMRRGNQFVALSGGTPTTKGEWNVYKRREQAQAEVRQAYQAKQAKIDTPSGLTALQNKQGTNEGPNAVVQGPYKTIDRSPSDITSRSALKSLSEQLLTQVKPNYLAGKIGQGRENLYKALEIMGDDDEMARLTYLSDSQFDAFWFGTNIAESVFMKYNLEHNNKDGSRKEKWQDKAIADAADELGDYITWAEGLPRGESQAANKRPGKEAGEVTRISNITR